MSVCAVAGCSHLYGDHGMVKNHDTDYLKAKSIQPLDIPPGYASSSIKASYPVSDTEYPENLKNIDLTPPGLNNPGK
jgi:uncharacterized lipoprotein